MLLKTIKKRNIQKPVFIVPASKPETQRAIIIAALADGVSHIYNDLRCVETKTMINACRSIGAKIIEHDEHLEIQGISGKIDFQERVIDSKGSGLVFRIFTVLASTCNKPVILSGDTTLRQRVMAPLFDALSKLGTKLECICDVDKAPIVNWSSELKGGKVTLPGDVSSQFITAILLCAPLAKEPIEIHVEGTVYSLSYIKQTIVSMEAAGIHVKTNNKFNYFRVEPGHYCAVDTNVGADYTSASYLFAYAALSNEKTIILRNIQKNSNQGERAIVDIIRTLGLEVIFDDNKNELVIHNSEDTLCGNFELHAIDYPNIIPTLAAIGSYVNGTFRVTGGSITQLHKAPRIKAMIKELSKLGVDIKALYNDEKYDGFEIKGKSQYKGGVEFSSWGDHRIFMSLFLTTLRAQQPCYLEGYADVVCSFPDFLEQFSHNGMCFEEIESSYHTEEK